MANEITANVKNLDMTHSPLRSRLTRIADRFGSDNALTLSKRDKMTEHVLAGRHHDMCTSLCHITRQRVCGFQTLCPAIP